MKKLLSVVLAVCASAVGAVEWQGLSASNWYSGRKLSSSDLMGKVVLVDMWGVDCGPCRALLPKMEKVWQTFKSKPFILIGSHCQGRQPAKVAELVEKCGLTYPIYDGVQLAGGPDSGSIPFLYVVDARGKVVFKGVGTGAERGAIEAVVNALETAIDPRNLCGNVTPVKFKGMQRQLVMGRSVESNVRILKQAAKGTDARAHEAEALLKAIDEAKEAFKDRIKMEQKDRPSAALADMANFRKTWPTDGKAYDADYKALVADTQVTKCAKVKLVLDKYRDFEPAAASGAKRALAEIQAAMHAADSLSTGSNAAVAAEAKAYADELAEISKALASQNAGKSR